MLISWLVAYGVIMAVAIRKVYLLNVKIVAARAVIGADS
jgi:hypothetical protein